MQVTGTGIYHDNLHKANTHREAAVKMAHASKKWLIDYQKDREDKQNYIRQHLLAQNLEMGML